MPYLRTLFLAFAISATMIGNAAHSAEASDIYFVAIGSQTYFPSPPGSPVTFSNVPAPENSATRVATALIANGARFGILLTSDRDHAVTKMDMESAVSAVKARVRTDRAKRPLIIFYFMGHALGDKYSLNLYMAPGDMTPRYLPSQTLTSALVRQTLTNSDVITSLEMFRLVPAMSFEDDFFVSSLTPDWSSLSDILRVLRYATQLTRQDNANRAAGLYPSGRILPVPFIALFDNCYDNVAQDLVSDRGEIRGGMAPGGSPLVAALGRMALQVRNQMLATSEESEEDGLVLYAARPGTEISHFTDPDDPTGLPVGSLARRLLVTMKAERPSYVSLGQFRDFLEMPDDRLREALPGAIDRSSPLPFTIQKADQMILQTVYLRRGPSGVDDGGRLERRIGSARISE